MLSITLTHPLDRITLDLSFTASGLTALLGPSGSGKTSVLNVVAGLLRPRHAVVRLDDDLLVDTRARIWMPAHRRRIGYVFQEPRLFPHLSVRHNLQYGPLVARARRAAVSFDDVVSLLDLGAFLGRPPTKLSGGEKQRVALGRALLSAPRLLLLDEPLASVDVARREEVLPYLDRLRADVGLPTIYVTHTWSEVTSRADRVLHIEHGQIVERRDRVRPDHIEPPAASD